MRTDKAVLQPIHLALNEFEEAIVKREHLSLLESQVLRRQEVDRWRRQLIDAVAAAVERERLEAERETDRRWRALVGSNPKQVRVPRLDQSWNPPAEDEDALPPWR
jgi:hypothetical protein